MAEHNILHFKKDCISCGACAAICPEYWKMDEEGLAHLKGSKEINDHWELKINTEEARACNQEAADVCPVNIIHVKEKEDA
jgi:ferredoxin